MLAAWPKSNRWKFPTNSGSTSNHWFPSRCLARSASVISDVPAAGASPWAARPPLGGRAHALVVQPFPQAAGALRKKRRQLSGTAAMRGGPDLLAYVLILT